MKRVNLLILTAFTMVFFACSEKKEKSSTAENSIDIENKILIHEPGFEMAMEVPLEYLSNNEAHVQYNENIGLLEVMLGEKFNMEISDLEMNISEFKESLQREQMFEYKISNEDKTGFVFQSFLPDGSEYSTNFIQKFELDGKIYTAKSKKGKEYSLDQIMKMRQAVSSVKTI